MTKKTRPERRLIIVSRRKTPDEAGLARLVSAMVLHQIREQQAENRQLSRVADRGTGTERSAP